MANQRKKGKVFIGAYCESELKQGLVKSARARGTSVTALLKTLIQKAVTAS